MRTDFAIGRLFGVQIALHISWFAIAFLLIFSLAQRFQELHSDWSGAAVWMTAAATALLFFFTLVLHELSHALVARSRGLPVRSITLFALGGVAEIEKESGDPQTEFWMGISGPLVSLAIGSGCLTSAHALGWVLLTEPVTPALAALVWLGYINLSLAAFNMIPAFPMDGGRILRAALWRVTGDPARATRAAARAGQVVAVGFMLLGLGQFLAGAGFGGLWIGFIGWFLLSAAGSSYGQASLKEALRGIRVAEVMRRDYLLVNGHINLEEFVERYLMRVGRCFMVTRKGSVVGLITLRDVRAVPRARWPYTTVDDAMQPLERVTSVSPQAPLNESLELMGRDDVHQLPVLEEGRLLGVISRGEVLQLLKDRAALQT
jgi:Zn-dependent protease/predicted transcriptional regulator